MMKRYFNLKTKRFSGAVALGALLLALSSCVKETIVAPMEPPVVPGSTIEFVTAGNNGFETRASGGHPIENGANIPAESAFGVYAYQIGFASAGAVEKFMNPANTSAVAFDNKAVTKDSGGTNGATYLPKVLWPALGSGQSLRFFAYYPQGHSALSVTQNATQEKVDIGYTLPGNPAQHIDLMVWMGDRLSAQTTTVPVQLGHALTRLKFQARMGSSYPTGTVIKITEIKIENAVTQGTLNIIPSGASWSLGTQKTALTMNTTNGLNSAYSLTTAYASVLTSDGADMLVIPQSMASGKTVSVKATIDGVEKTFSYDLNGTAAWTMNQSVTYQFTFDWDGIGLTTSVADWTKVDSHIIFDGAYYLKSSYEVINLGSAGGTPVIRVETNYDGGFNGVGGNSLPAGLSLSASPAFGTAMLGSNTGSGGIHKHTISLNIPASASARNTSLGVKAGNMNLTININQSATPWLTVVSSSGSSAYPMDGSLHSFSLNASVPWEVTAVSGADIILPVNGLLDVNQWIGINGSSAAVSFPFYLKGQSTAGQVVSVTVKDLTGANPDQTVNVTAVN